MFKPAKLSRFKKELFERVALYFGGLIRGDVDELAALPETTIPIVGCMLECKPLIARWKETGRTWIYWDRGYCRRVFATHLPRGENGGYYRWHINAYQMSRIRDVPGDRWKELNTRLTPWNKGGSHIVLGVPSIHYLRFHGIEDWAAQTEATLRQYTDRKIVVRAKDSPKSLAEEVAHAHALVTHASNVGAEAAILGCPVFVHEESAAKFVGLTDLSQIETPIRPDRERWSWSLAYCQMHEKEMANGTLFRLIE